MKFNSMLCQAKYLLAIAKRLGFMTIDEFMRKDALQFNTCCQYWRQYHKR